MTDNLLSASLLPEPLWNTHLACLRRLCDAAGLGLDTVEVAGATGLAFRTALCRSALPASLYHCWPWTQEFLRCCALLGLDAEAYEQRAGSAALTSWARRRSMDIEGALVLGWPALFWDSLGFSLVLGANEEHCFVSGLPEFVISSEWRSVRQVEPLLARAQRSGEDAFARECGWDVLLPLVGQEAFVLTLHGAATIEQRMMDEFGIFSCWQELSGRVEYERRRFGAGADSEPLFGTAALERLSEELRGGSVHPFGLHQALASLAELRRFAAAYLRRLASRMEDFAPRLLQCAAFFEQASAHLRPAVEIYSAPDAEPPRQAQAQQARQSLYEMQRLEQTAARLLGGMVEELFEG